jgi:hypothetical protein
MKTCFFFKAPFILIIFMLVLSVNLVQAEYIFISEFDTGSDGFIYEDDVFEGTSNPAYASGDYVSDGGYSAGGLRVRLGGVDNSTVAGMSGGWSREFSVPSSSLVRVSLWYRLVFQGTYEGDEYGEALVAIDGELFSPEDTGVLARFYGDDPQSGVVKDSGWRQAVFDVNLFPGFHMITVGGYNNQKTRSNEYMEVYFDEIELSLLDTTPYMAVSPQELSFSMVEGTGVLSQQLQVLASDGEAVVYDVSGNAGWLTVNPGTGLTPDEVTVEVDGSGLAVGSYSAQITVSADGYAVGKCTVNLTVDAMPHMVVTPQVLNFSMVEGADILSQKLQVSASDGEAVLYDVIGNAGWLTVNPGTGQTPDEVTVVVDGSGLTVGSYSGQITVSADGYTTVVCVVELTVSDVDLNVLDAWFDAGSDGFIYEDDVFEGTSNPAYASGDYVSDGGYSAGGLRVRLGGVDNSTVAGMSGGWSREFSVPSSSLVRVSLWYRLVFQGTYEGDEYGEALVAIDGELFSPEDTGVLARFYGDDPQSGVVKDSGWRQAVFDVNLFPGFHMITVGGYNNQKTRSNEYMEVYFDEIELSLLDTTPYMAVSPQELSFSMVEGTGVLSQQLQVLASDGEAVVYDVSGNAGWLTVNPGTGLTPDEVTVEVDGSGLAVGSYSAQITVSADGYAVGKCTVNLTVDAMPHMVVTPQVLNFSMVEGADILSQKLQVSASDGEAVLYDVIGNAGWLTVNPGTGQTPDEVTVVVDGSGLTVGSYSGQITVSADGYTTVVCVVELTVSDVDLNVLDAWFDAGSDGFIYEDDVFEGTSNPAYASGDYVSDGGYSAGGLRVRLGGVDNSTVAGMSGGWSREFSVPSSSLVRVSLWYRLVFQGTYEGDEYGEALVAIDGELFSPEDTGVLARFYGDDPQSGVVKDSGWRQAVFDVNLFPGFHMITVGGYNNQKTRSNEYMEVYFDEIELSLLDTTPYMAVSPQELSFSMVEGTGVLSQQLQVLASDGEAVVYDVSGNAGWLTVNPGTGLTPDEVTVEVDGSGLAVGSYSAQITVSADGYAVGKCTVNLTVDAMPHMVVTPQVLNFSMVEGADILSQKLQVSASDGEAVLYDVIGNAGWLTVNPGTGQTPDEVTVVVDGSGLTVGSYSGQITVSADGYTTVVCVVELTVSDVDLNVLDAWFDAGSDGFIYEDDVFEGTSNPAYASGDYVSDGGYSAGGLRVRLGGVDNSTVAGMSGGWSREFSVPSSSLVRVSLWYRLVFQGTYEGDEYGEALVAIDGELFSPEDTGVLARFYGDDPQSGVVKDSGWRQAVFDVNLFPGFHMITVGGYNNQKTRSNEYMEVYFDEIELSLLDTTPYMAVSPQELSFSMVEGTGVLSQQLQVLASDGEAVVYDVSGNAGWLTVNPGTGLTPDEVTVEVDGSGLAVGSYSAQITVSADGYAVGKCTVNLTVSDGSIYFFEDFQSAYTDNWMVINDSGLSSNWNVVDGKYIIQ